MFSAGVGTSDAAYSSMAASPRCAATLSSDARVLASSSKVVRVDSLILDFPKLF
jgi:hypothetical protein